MDGRSDVTPPTVGFDWRAFSECRLNPPNDPWQGHHQEQGGRDRVRDTVVTEPPLYFTQQSIKTHKKHQSFATSSAAKCWYTNDRDELTRSAFPAFFRANKIQDSKAIKMTQLERVEWLEATRFTVTAGTVNAFIFIYFLTQMLNRFVNKRQQQQKNKHKIQGLNWNLSSSGPTSPNKGVCYFTTHDLPVPS